MAATVAAFAVLSPLCADAVPVFAHRYGVSCKACHTIVPELNAFGQRFRDSGYRWPAAIPLNGTLPVAIKMNIAYARASDPDGLPKWVVDEIEFLSFGPIGNRFAYRVEQYLVDGGRPGLTRDAFLEYKSAPESAWHDYKTPVLDVQLGQFTLPLPNDPETMRPTQNHYAILDQTIGDNAFNLFDDRIGLNVGFGDRFAEVRALAMKGHDPQSGLRTSGTDTMLSVRAGAVPLSVWAYQYRGVRPLGVVTDGFVRRGIALTSAIGKAQTSFLVQTGSDSSATGFGDAALSSGGYFQEEWAFNDRLIATVRYDALHGPEGLLRSTTVSLSHRPYDRARWTIEDVIQSRPQTTHTLSAAWLFAY